MRPTVPLEIARPVLERMAQTLFATIRRSVTPLAVILPDRTLQWGTGTYFRVADDSFVVTAAHLWTEAVKYGVQDSLHIFDVSGEHEQGVSIRPVPLNGNVYRADDPADVALFHLDSETVSRISDAHYLRLNQVKLAPQHPVRCWVFGFPQELAKDVPHERLFRFEHLFLYVPFYAGETFLENYEPRLHFLLDAARNDLVGFDGTPADLPRPHGISGCSVWQTAWPADNRPESFDPEQTRIVGVETSYYPDRSLIKATAWGAVASVLWQSRPDLRDAIEMTLGPLTTWR